MKQKVNESIIASNILTEKKPPGRTNQILHSCPISKMTDPHGVHDHYFSILDINVFILIDIPHHNYIDWNNLVFILILSTLVIICSVYYCDHPPTNQPTD